MNLDDALLIKTVITHLAGSSGMTHGQLAHKCHISQRRMTHHLFNMEKAGLIDHSDNGMVYLANDLMGTAYVHADRLNNSGAKMEREGYTTALRTAIKLKEVADTKFINDVFGAVFGGPKPVHGSRS